MGDQRCHLGSPKGRLLSYPSFYPAVLGSEPHNTRAMPLDNRGFVKESHESLGPAATPEARTARAKETGDSDGSLNPSKLGFPEPAGDKVTRNSLRSPPGCPGFKERGRMILSP